MRENAVRALPVRIVERYLILDEMAQAVANRPRPADEPAHLLLPAEPLESDRVIFRKACIVPADGPANLIAMRVDSAARVMRRRDAAGDPVVQPLLRPQRFGDGADAGASLALELHQVQFADAPARP